MKQWVKFFLAVLRYGRLWQPIRLNPESLKNTSAFKRTFLKTPILCQLISLVHLYRQNKYQPHGIYHLDSQKLAYISINKNASTSILSALMKTDNQEVDLKNHSNHWLHRKAREQMKGAIDNGYKGFAVVRDPKDRLLSCYHDQVLIKDEIGYFDHLYFGMFRSDLTFDQFVKLASKIPDSIKEPHIKLQKHCIPKDSGIQIFKFENLNHELIPFLKNYGVMLEWKNRSRDKKNDSISKETESLIKSIYYEDYKAFNY